MRFERVTSPQHPLCKRAMALYADSFPPHEQRENASQLRILGDEAYRFNLVYDENTFVGLALCWRTERFIYLEHFCILPEVRSQRKQPDGCSSHRACRCCGLIAPPKAAEGRRFYKSPPETRACRKAVARGVKKKGLRPLHASQAFKRDFFDNLSGASCFRGSAAVLCLFYFRFLPIISRQAAGRGSSQITSSTSARLP